MANLLLALRCFFCVLLGKPLPAAALRPVTPPERPAKAKTSGVKSTEAGAGAVWLLAVLRKEGRLIDFLQESIDAYDDAQIGAAVRNIHRDCQRALSEHCRLEPVLSGIEDSPVTVDSGFDPGRIRLMGNVTGKPPFSGVLRHHGWRVAELKLEHLASVADAMVVAPAEVEVN